MLSLTAKGTARYTRLVLAEAARKPRRWDRHWRIVIFDIPEKYRHSRDLLRREFIGIGFFKLQESVWVYPYDCEDLVALMKTQFSKGMQVLYIVSEHVENDVFLRKQFGLPIR